MAFFVMGKKDESLCALCDSVVSESGGLLWK